MNFNHELSVVQPVASRLTDCATAAQYRFLTLLKNFRWIDNIKIDLLEIGVNVVDWIGLAQDRYRWSALVNSVMNLRVP
jgi:hypothetical protein